MEKSKDNMKQFISITLALPLIVFASCKPQFEKIEYGKEACSHCKMTIVDVRFAAEMVTSKGRAYKFDDILCMKQYADNNTDQSNNALFFVAVYGSDNNDEFTDAKKAVYLKDDFFRSPMNGNYAAFSTTEAVKKLKDSLNIQPIAWEAIQ